MFNNCTAQAQQGQDLIQNKRHNFRLEIRHRQIEQIKSQTRRMHLQKINHIDYALLKNINLTVLLKNLKCLGAEEDTIHKLFLYASSGGCDHMFQMFDDHMVSILVQNLLKTEKEKIWWNRQIFWILTGYTVFSNILNRDYIAKMTMIADILFEQGTKQIINYSDQTQKNIVISMSRYIQNADNCRHILENQSHLLHVILRRFWNRKPSLDQLISQNSRSLPNLITFYCELIHNLYSNLQYSEIDEDDQINILRQIKKIFNSFLTHSPLRQDQTKLILILIDALTKLFGHSLDSHPELINSFQKYFIKLGVWFDNLRINQKESEKFRDIVIGYLRLIQVIYGSNIPQQLQAQVNEFYKRFFHSHVSAIADKYLRQSDLLLQNCTLQMMQSVLMQTQMTVFIINQYSPLLSIILMGVQSFPFNLKKQALICVVNVLKSGVANNQELSSLEIVELLSTDGISDILARYLYEYVDESLNLEIIKGIDILLDAESNQYQAGTNFWIKFTQAGGGIKMQKILSESGSNTLKQSILKVVEKARKYESDYHCQQDNH